MSISFSVQYDQLLCPSIKTSIPFLAFTQHVKRLRTFHIHFRVNPCRHVIEQNNLPSINSRLPLFPPLPPHHPFKPSHQPQPHLTSLHPHYLHPLTFNLYHLLLPYTHFPSISSCMGSPNSPPPDLPNDPARYLISALQLPRASRKISDWLFKNRRKKFHTDDFLPPHAFNNSIILQIRQFFSDQNQNDNIEPIFILLIPVDVFDGISLGYSLALGNLGDARLLPCDEGLKLEKSLGRFAFDRVKRHLVGVMHDVTETCTVLFTVDHLRGNKRQRSFISIPNLDYTFEHPPAQVLGIITKTEVKLSSVKRTVPVHPSESSIFSGGGEGTWSGLDVRQLHPNVLYDLIPREYKNGHLMDENAQLGLKKVSPSWKTFNNVQTPRKHKSLFDMRTVNTPSTMVGKPSASISDCLDDLENVLEGEFAASKVVRCVKNEGKWKVSTAKNLRCFMNIGNTSMHDNLKRVAAEAYYAVALPL